MHVVATAGHVDHGKSALVRALTGTDPDRLEEERRRGLSIRLGYAWTSLPGAGDVAFVDVPGHERFITTMLAGVGPVPAVLFVVAADDLWMPQAAEHLAALDALQVQHAVVAVTRSDLADPAPAEARVAAQLDGTSLQGSPVVPVSSRTGSGLPVLRARLVELVTHVPVPDPHADVRLWVDRRFTISGAGTVVTGTLPAGTVAVGDRLGTGTGTVRVRGVQTLGRTVESVSGLARVALNVSGDVTDLDRTGCLTTPGAHRWTEVIDVRLVGEVDRLPLQPMLHVGAMSLTVRCRPLADDLVRLTLPQPLPLRVGDRALVRDPGSRQVWGVQVLDPLPPPLRRRGAALDRARALRAVSGEPDLVSEVDRRQVVDVDTLRQVGVPDLAAPGPVVRAGRWVMSAGRAELAAGQVLQTLAEHDRAHPLERGLPLTVLADRVGLPSPDLVAAVVREPLRVVGGRVMAAAVDVLPAELERALATLADDLAGNPFQAPTADRLRDLGLDAARVAAAAKAGRLLRLAPGIVLMPDADRRAVDALTDLPQPFTTSEARSRLGTSRRVVLPLLEHLDRARLTRRLPDDRRVVL
ncbi:selenocysteine-specific translation elongation factor [Cellulomonas aerilata]|uniref:Selenocysteine-specific translation elongation factor n=1 Tax=Cellulomonas aerilata TaxID=515326 RepID=A0A512DCC7_9CELL|nr:selenocysteine-specific translation elongation factor [Cellulomonas aerilata]GEO34142.1 selenocysteine-specific translation elongation factor [Cellulomonas aerilata]